jgi:hypothetical protein
MSDDDPSSADPLGEIANEFVEAFRQGQRPSVEEFARRHPDHADDIREMLPALVLLEKAKAADDAAGPVETTPRQIRAGFRRQALDWLRAELESWRRLLEREPAQEPGMIAHGLQRWPRDPYFDGMREADALSRLPVAERQAWQRLWADVADMLARAEGTTPPEPKAGSKIPLSER